ncbi:MAG: GNAT family N-acetyltransferase [Vicinamibacterales bacterium]
MSAPFADLALARRLEGCEGWSNVDFVEARARVMPEVGACWTQSGGALAMFDGAESPVTQTFGVGLFEPPDARMLSELEQFFESRGAPVWHEVSPLADPALLTLLNERHYQPRELTSVLYRDPKAPVSAVVAPAASVRIVGAADADVWGDTSVRGWSESPEVADFMLGLARVTAARRHAVMFLAEMAGRPVGAAALSVRDDVAQLAGASTVLEARRHGVQLALLEARLRFAAAQGCELVTMGALPGSASQRNAERHGFRIAYTRIKWLRRS